MGGMTDIDGKIITLTSICKGSVSITFNEHTTNYQTIEQYLYDSFGRERFSDLDDEDKQAIIKAGQIVEVQAYPRTPVGFILATHHDLSEALDMAIEGARDY